MIILAGTKLQNRTFCPFLPKSGINIHFKPNLPLATAVKLLNFYQSQILDGSCFKV